MARKKRKYRVLVEMHDQGWIEVEATSDQQAKKLAEQTVGSSDGTCLDSMNTDLFPDHDHWVYAQTAEEVKVWTVQRRKMERGAKWETVGTREDEDEAHEVMIEDAPDPGEPGYGDHEHRLVGPDSKVASTMRVLRGPKDIGRKDSMGKKVRL